MIDEPEIHETPTVSAAVLHLDVPRSEMQEAFRKAIHEILDALSAQDLSPAGPPFARHFRFDPDRFDFEVGFPIDAPMRPAGRMQPGELPSARVVRTVYRGAYEGLPSAWEAFQARVRADNLQVMDEFRERYVVGPESGPDPSGWQTELSWVLRG